MQGTFCVLKISISLQTTSAAEVHLAQWFSLRCPRTACGSYRSLLWLSNNLYFIYNYSSLHVQVKNRFSDPKILWVSFFGYLLIASEYHWSSRTALNCMLNIEQRKFSETPSRDVKTSNNNSTNLQRIKRKI